MIQKKILPYLTITFILLGLFISLSILKGDTTGYSILKNQEYQLNISSANKLTNFPGEKINFPIIIKNTGNMALTNCKFSATNEIKNWIYTNQIENLISNEEKQINIEINIPEQIEPQIYAGNLEVICNEKQISSPLQITISPFENIIKIKHIEFEKNNLNIFYEFNNSNIIGELTSIKIKILNQENIEIINYTDSFNLNKNPPISRNISIPFLKDLTGIFYLELSMYSHPEISTKQSLILGNSITTGNAILKKENKNLIGYLFFIGIIFLVIFIFLYRNIKFSKNLKIPQN